MKENTEGKLKQTHHTMRRVKEKNRRRTPEKTEQAARGKQHERKTNKI
jgi:hypothetical protein